MCDQTFHAGRHTSILSVAQQPLDQGLLSAEAQSVGLLWRSDLPVLLTSI
jgi:hypothetical protein